MSTDLCALLEENFGFSQFRPGQEAVINELINGSGRALAVFPTGGGKSLCYQLPALALEGTTLVVSPLIALMKDQIDFLRSKGIKAASLDSTLDFEQTKQVNDDLRNGELKLLYVAPERFNNERFRDMIARANLSLFAVDEAHCISEWGHNFRPDYLKLAQFARELNVPRILALTATATPKVAKSICQSFEIEDGAAINTGFYRANLRLCLTPVPDNRRLEVLLKRLQNRRTGATIIYVTLQKTAHAVSNFLNQNGIEARPYHAGMEALDRSTTQEWWMAGERIVVATIAFGMGIDKADVRYVYHFNLPKGLENYSQEIGRAGRDNEPSVVEMLACPDDVPTLENFVYGDTPTPESLHGFVEEILSLGPEFSIKDYDMSTRHDLRSLVMRTALTYLELGGVLKQGTPYYAGYEVRPHESLNAIYAAFGEKASRFLRDLFATAKRGRIWLKIDPDEAMEKLGCSRESIVRAMEMLEQKNVAQVRAADARQRYTRLRDEEDADALVADLQQRFALREKAEIKRVGDVLKLVEYQGCQTNALVRYFGEKRPEPCGHCSFCVTQEAAILPPARELPNLESRVDAETLARLRDSHPQALATPRQMARFLCGLTSPAVSRAKLPKHELFATLENYRFVEVMSWCEAQNSKAQNHL